MFKKISKRAVTFILAVVMLVTVLPLQPVAAEEAEGNVTNYADFMTNLKVLEGYAEEYAAQIPDKDAGELVLNFIRTGVERYQDDNWNTLAGREIIAFTNYVANKDEEHGTAAMSLKNIVISNFKLPNGNLVDFGHMFGCMNISYVAPGSADLSGWAGDICDLLQYSVTQLNSIEGYAEGDVEKMAAYIQKNCFGVNATGAYGWDDFWGDMDAYYLISEYKKATGEDKKFSKIMDAYFTASLEDVARTVYFMNNRFAVADSQEAVRKAIYEAYTADVGLKILESKRGLTSYNALRQACCYAFADYVYSQAKGQLVEGAPSDSGPENGYYSVFSNEHSVLAPGVVQDINYAQTADGKQIVYYVATVDIARDDLDLMINYQNNRPPVATGENKNIGMQKVEDQVAALINNNKDKDNFYPIVATNGAGYNITTGFPAGLVVMNGVEYNPINGTGFFAILNDGSAVIGDPAEYAKLKEDGKVKEAIQAFGAILVKDGKINVTKNANYTASRASRTAIGITAEGKVVMMVLDGRQLPRSAGGAMEEIAQIMLEAGCVQAINLDGGGSTTYMSKPAGSDSIQLVNTPSDGYARSVATSLVVVSTAEPDTAFDHAIISSDYEYITAGTSMQFSATGVSNTGNAATIPEGAYWAVSDETLASIDENGLFTAAWSEEGPVVGDVKVQFIVDGVVEGEKTVHIVIPDDIKFAEDRITAIYGVPREIEVTVWYKGFPVAFTPLVDAGVVLYSIDEEGNLVGALESAAGILTFNEAGDKQIFIGDGTNGVRIANIAAMLVDSEVKPRFGTISLYRKDEATFDFENADQGNRKLAWNRVIENAKTLDNQLYRISDPDSPVVIDYTFALDMTAIDFPAQLEDLKSMLPTYQEGATAWTYMLQLAERVCTQTNVTITAEFSKDLEVDITNLKVINEYFTVTYANLDANNVLTLKCNWVNQSEPIDAATANPLCILSGIKLTVKDTAAWFNNEILITNNGYVTYDIYLAASSLYSFAQNTTNQAAYGLYPYIHEEDCRGDFSTDLGDDETLENNDRGARFSSQYIDFADIYVLNSEVLQGWQEEGSDYYFYKDNAPVTGIQLVTDRKNPDALRFYEFDATGKLISEQGSTELITFEGDLYYAVLGVAQTGWQVVDGNNYYFHPDTGKAVDGVYTISEKQNPAIGDGKYTPTIAYTYTFTDHILTLGDWVYDTNINGNDGKKHTGWRYRWAGDWKDGWFEVEGEWYHAHKDYPNMTSTGFIRIMKQNAASSSDTQYHLLTKDEKGALCKEFTGVYFDGTSYHYLMNGMRQVIAGLYEADGYYYYVNGNNGLLYVDQTDFEVNKDRAHGLVPAGKYNFDSQGRLKNPLITVESKPANVETEIIGRVTTVTVTDDTPACKVGYKDGDKYVTIEATKDENGYNFVAPKDANVTIVVAGDTDGNGKVEASDAEDLLKSILGKLKSGEELSAEELLAADVNGDGKFTAIDAALINAAGVGALKLGW